MHHSGFKLRYEHYIFVLQKLTEIISANFYFESQWVNLGSRVLFKGEKLSEHLI